MTKEIWQHSASDLATAIRDKKISSQEVVQSHLDRIKTVNRDLNAITVVLTDDALRSAKAADKAIAEGDYIGPLHGVPFTIKENIDLAGSASTEGVVALAEAIPPIDAPQIARILEAGAIPIGRTNMPDFALRWHTDNNLRGATVNPWNSSLTPGGSSGGEAVALATGMTPLGIGNDYGGSLRWPTQCCGTTAIRPTLGRVPSASSLAPAEAMLTFQLFGVQGPMARHAKDLRLALSLMSKADPRDPWWVPAPFYGPTQSSPIKVAVTLNPGGQGIDPNVAAGITTAAKALQKAGYIVEEVEAPSISEAHDLWAQLAVTEINTFALPALQPIISSDAGLFIDMLTDMYPILDIAGYGGLLAERNRIAREWSMFQEKYPLVLGPVSTMQPFEVGMDVGNKHKSAEFVNSLRLVTSMNLLGLPSVVTPIQVTDGLPQAVQIIGSRFREDLCLDAAEAIENQLGILTPIDPRRS